MCALHFYYIVDLTAECYISQAHIPKQQDCVKKKVYLAFLTSQQEAMCTVGETGASCHTFFSSEYFLEWVI